MIYPCKKFLQLGLFVLLPVASQAVIIGGNFEIYPDGNDVNSISAALDDGWYAFDSGDRTARVESNLNSPFASGSQSVELIRPSGGTSNPTLVHTFNNHNQSGVGQITGSLGGTLAGSGWSISFDWRQTTLATQMQFAAVGTDRNNNNRAFRVEARANGGMRINGDGDNEIPNIFSANEWYRVQITNLNLDTQTFDLDVIAWDDGEQTVVYSETGFGFENDRSELAYIRWASFGNTPHTIWVDEVSVVPEPATVALLFGMSAFAFILWRRRKA